MIDPSGQECGFAVCIYGNVAACCLVDIIAAMLILIALQVRVALSAQCLCFIAADHADEKREKAGPSVEKY